MSLQPIHVEERRWIVTELSQFQVNNSNILRCKAKKKKNG